MKKITIISMFAAVVLVFASCGPSTRILTSWTPDNMQGVKLDNVLVMSVLGPDYFSYQEALEASIVRQLGESGIRATSGMEFFGPNGFMGMSDQEVYNKISQFNQVMLVSLNYRDRVINYRAGTVTRQEVIVPINPFFDQYKLVHRRAYEPGEFIINKHYMINAYIFSTADDKLIYSAEAKTINPRSSAYLVRSFSETIMVDMKAQGLIR